MGRFAILVIAAFLVAGCVSWNADSGNSTANGTGSSGQNSSTTGTATGNATGSSSSSSPSSASSTSSSATSNATTTSTTSTTNSTTTAPASNVTLNSTHIGLRTLAGSRIPSCGVVRIGSNCHVVFVKAWSNITTDVDVSAERWVATTESNRQQVATLSDKPLVLAGTNGTVMLRWAVADSENGDRIQSLRYASPKYNATILVPTYPTARMPVTDGGAVVTALRLGCHAAYYACPMPSNHLNDLVIAGVAGDPLNPAAPQHAFNGTLRITVTKGIYNITSTEPYEELYAAETLIHAESTTGTNPLRSLFQLPAVTIETGYEYRIHVRATMEATGAIVEATHSWHY